MTITVIYVLYKACLVYKEFSTRNVYIETRSGVHMENFENPETKKRIQTLL